jgi:hypothetical protein
VNGTNFAYFTTATMAILDPKPYNALVTVHVSTNGTVSLTGIKPIQLISGSGEGGLGGYSAFDSIDNSPIPGILRELVGDGVSYVVLAIATQVVNGINYAIFAEACVIYPEATPYNVIITLHQDLKGAYHLIAIEQI